MAVNEHEASLKITAKNDASKPLKGAADDLAKFQDAVKTAGTLLDEHKGSPRAFAEAMKNAFKGIPAIADEAVGKISRAMSELDQALSDSDINIGITQKQVASYEKAAAAIREQVEATQALKDAETARYKAEKSALDHLKDAEAQVAAQSKAAAEARINEINQSVKAQRDLVEEIEAQIKAEQRLENARAKRSNKRQQEVLDLGIKRSELQAQRDAVEADVRENARPQAIKEREARVSAVEGEISALGKLREELRKTSKQRHDEVRDAWKTNGVDYSNDPAAKTKAIQDAKFAANKVVKDFDAQIEKVGAERVALMEASTALRKEIKGIQDGGDFGPTPGNDRLKALDAEIAELDKLIGRKEKSQSLDDKKSAEAKKNIHGLSARRDAASPDVVRADAEIKAINDKAAAEKAAGEARIKAQQKLTEDTKTETSKRLTILNKEIADQRKAYRAESANLRSGSKSLAGMIEVRERTAAEREQLGEIHDRAVALRNSVTDPMSLRRVARSISGGPDTQAKGMAALTEQTRRAADAQRLLNGEVKTGNSGFNSAKSYIMGLVSAYALYATAITQASKAIDAYKAKESFQITVSNTLGGDMAKAAGEFDYLTDTANKYGFAISAISQEYAKLAATARGIGRSDKDIRSLFEGVLSVGRVNALSDEKMQDAFRAVTQILSKNQVMSEELKGQLAEALPGAVVGFAKSQGYNPDQMKEFAKDLEAGKFAARDIIEYAQTELEKNASAVLRAQNTFQATMARFQNTLFKSRADFAENGFMDALTETIRELDEFFKSDDGKAYLIRLGEGAQVAVSALATVAKNLDVIVSVLGVVAMAWGGSKVSKMFAGMAAGAASAAQGVTATGVAATRAAKGVAVLGAGLRGLMGLMGGIPGIALMMAGALWSYASSQNAEKTAEAQSRLDRIREVIGDIRTAAVEAEGDVKAFVAGLGAIKGMTGTQQIELKRDVAQAKADVRDAVSEVISGAFAKENGVWKRAGQLLTDGVITANSGDAGRLARVGAQISKGGFDAKAVNAELDAIAKANPEMTEYVVNMQRLVAQMVELESAQRDVTEAIDNANGKGETAQEQMKRHTTENRNATEAATLAAEAQKKFEASLESAGKTADDGADGHKAYADAIKAADKFREESVKLLKEWIEQEKLAGKAIPADEIERQTRRISDSVRQMTDKAAADFARFSAEAAGMSVSLSDVVASALAAKEQVANFTQTTLDPLGTFGSTGVTPQGREGILASLSRTESGGRFHIQNSEGYAGRLQFGDARLADYKRATGESFTKEQFRLNPELQKRVEQWHLADIEGRVAPYVGRVVNGQTMTMGALVGMAHLGGTGGAVKYVETGGRYNPSDSNGTHLSDYARTHANAYGAQGAVAYGAQGTVAGRTVGTATGSVNDSRVAIETATRVADGFSDQAMEQLQLFLVQFPQALSHEMMMAMAKGDATAVASMMREAGGGTYADAFTSKNAINAQARTAEATVEAANAFKDAADKISFDADDLKAGNRKAAVDRETATLINEMSEGGADIAAATRTASREEAETLLRARVERQLSVELAKQQRDLAADMAESDAQARRDAQQRVEVQNVQNAQGERAAELLRIQNELRNEEQDSGVSRSDAERDQIAQLRIRAWDAENAERLAKEAKDKAEKSRDEAEKVHTDKIKTLQDKLAYLNDQLAVAIENRDATTQNRLKDEIRGVSEELITATQAAEQFYGTLSGPEGEQGVLAMQRLRLEAERSAAQMGQMSPEAQEIAAVIENSLNGAVSTFAEKVASGMSVWDALKSTVAQAIGEILVNIGKMIVQAVIANSVMSALGLPSQYATPAANAATAAKGGPLTSIVGFLGGLVGGIHHDGGVIGDPSKNIDFLAALMNLGPNERPIIAEDGEEMLTRRDPRHRDNMGAAIARFHRFHTGGIIGSVPDPAGSALSSGAAGRAMAAAAAQSAAPATPGNVTVINALDEQDIVDRALSTPAGERLIMNVFAKNKSKFKGMMG